VDVGRPGAERHNLPSVYEQTSIFLLAVPCELKLPCGKVGHCQRAPPFKVGTCSIQHPVKVELATRLIAARHFQIVLCLMNSSQKLIASLRRLKL
jgi:hypothetical protein